MAERPLHWHVISEWCVWWPLKLNRVSWLYNVHCMRAAQTKTSIVCRSKSGQTKWVICTLVASASNASAHEARISLSSDRRSREMRHWASTTAAQAINNTPESERATNRCAACNFCYDKTIHQRVCLREARRMPAKSKVTANACKQVHRRRARREIAGGERVARWWSMEISAHGSMRFAVFAAQKSHNQSRSDFHISSRLPIRLARDEICCRMGNTRESLLRIEVCDLHKIWRLLSLLAVYCNCTSRPDLKLETHAELESCRSLFYEISELLLYVFWLCLPSVRCVFYRNIWDNLLGLGQSKYIQPKKVWILEIKASSYGLKVKII